MRIVVLAMVSLAAVPVSAQSDYEIGYERTSLGYEALVANNNQLALDQMEKSRSIRFDDPAKLINMGSAYVRLGDYTRAKDAFKAALRSKNEAILVLADGSEISSRDAAIQALKKLRAGNR